MSKVIGAGFDFSESLSFLPADLFGLRVSSSGTSGTFGAWVQLLADIGNNDIYLEYLRTTINFDQTIHFQVGLGAGGSEVPITDNVIESEGAVTQTRSHLLGKVRVKANSRLAIRVTDDNNGVLAYDIWLHYSKR